MMRPERADFGSASSDLGSEKADLWSEKANMRHRT